MAIGTSAISSNANAPKISDILGGTKITPNKTETRLYQTNPTINDLKGFLKEMSLQYGQNYEEMKAVIQCESSWNWRADNGISYGIAQFTPITWKEFGQGDIFNPYSQIRVMAKMWSRGLQNRWDCYRKLY